MIYKLIVIALLHGHIGGATWTFKDPTVRESVANTVRKVLKAEKPLVWCTREQEA